MSENHEHTRTCFGHDKHWMDDSVYVNYGEEGAPVEDDSPGKEELIDLLEAAIDDDQKIFRFALVFVDEKGFIQLGTNPGMTPDTTINLLAKAISIMAVQEQIDDQMAYAQGMQKLGKALGMAANGEGPMPDLSSIFGGMDDNDSEEIITNNMREGYL
jgi:hypothetical protein